MTSIADLPERPGPAIRILHTSDWHLGVTVRNHSRADDHDAVIAEIVEIAVTAQPDLIVHTGDLFDGHRPAMPEFGRAIRALRSLAQVAPVALMSGNHDSPVALEVLALAVADPTSDDADFDPLTPTTDRIKVHAKPTTADRGAVTTYSTRSGGKLRLVALPFVHQNRVVREFSELVEANATYNDALRTIIGSYSELCFDSFDPSTDVAVFASHLHVRDARTSSEKTIHIAEDYATDPAHFESRYGYLAFGHIHVPQAVADGRGRYAGSILEVDFGEEGETKQVNIIDLTPGRPAQIYSIELTAGRRLHRLRCALSELATHTDRTGSGIVEVTVTPEIDADGNAEPPTDPIIISDVTFDTLSSAVAALLPDATVVSVIDGRNPTVSPADELDAPTSNESIGDLFRGWLTTDSSTLFSQPAHLGAEPARVAAMFDEFYTAATTGADPELAELTQLERLEEAG